MKTAVFFITVALANTIHAVQFELTCQSSLNLANVELTSVGSISCPMIRMKDLDDNVDPRVVSVWKNGVISFKSGAPDNYKMGSLKFYSNVTLFYVSWKQEIAIAKTMGFKLYQGSEESENDKFCILLAPEGTNTATITIGRLSNKLIWWAAFLPENAVFS